MSNFTDTYIPSYKDLDISLDYSPFSGDFRVKKDIDSINQSIKNILYTKKGDKPLMPSFGCGIHSLLFENLDGITETQIQQEIVVSLTAYEPRIYLLDVRVSRDESDPQSIAIYVTYALKSAPEPITLKFIINRSR